MYEAEWVATLPLDEQQEYAAARARQNSLRSVAIEQGKMEIDNSSDAQDYIWKDESALTINKPNDDVWLKYWDRYLAETQTIFTIEVE